MKHRFDAAKCRTEWQDFIQLLASKPKLSETGDILPFFKQCPDLSLLICKYFPKAKNPDVLAHEYEIYGDFVADLVVGDSAAHQYLLVEFEDATPDSIFKYKGKKSTPDWSPRIECAYSQLVDWLWKLEDMRSTNDFFCEFGSHRARFQGLIVIGKDMKLAQREIDRLRWRMDRTLIDSNAISVVSFDELAEEFDYWLKTHHGV
ncbi:Shedu immune nuclease family protein [Methylomagnum ishizawai]|uniref:Shedu immune nuclease family protein n=1 Tax=Methylomagnum ishizawai TaxID=1760988 RepID=UPI001C80734E|nr:Shedu immune nuclease family protein [Methylomagnum ishizawai]